MLEGESDVDELRIRMREGVLLRVLMRLTSL